MHEATAAAGEATHGGPTLGVESREVELCVGTALAARGVTDLELDLCVGYALAAKDFAGFEFRTGRWRRLRRLRWRGG